MICNNEIEAIELNPEDRKFIAIKTTESNFQTTMGAEFVTLFSESIKDINLQARYYAWLRDKFNKPKYISTELAPKNHWFEQVVRASCNTSIRPFLNDLIDGVVNKISYEEARESHYTMKSRGGLHFLNDFKFRRFFENFTWQGKKIFKVEKDIVYRLDDKGNTHYDEHNEIEILGD
jgi:hypothetical protein